MPVGTAERSPGRSGGDAPGPALRLAGLTAGYRGVPSVSDIDLDVYPGEVVALLGPNGAGKTTVLLSAVGQLPLMSGNAEALGHRVSARRPTKLARLGVGVVPDNRGLFLQLSVGDNLRLVHPKRASLDEIVGAFPALESLMGRRCGLLSGGEQQMLALAKVLLARPRLLVIDEMSHGLAPKIAAGLLSTVRRMADDDGTAVLLVEQHVRLALAVADRAYVLRLGSVVMSGTTAEMSRSKAALDAAYFGEVPV